MLANSSSKPDSGGREHMMEKRTMPLGRSMDEQAKMSVSRSPQGNLAKGPGGGNGVGMPKKGDQSRGGAHSPAPHNLLKRTRKSNQRDQSDRRSTSATVPGPFLPCLSACRLLAAAAVVALIQCNVQKQKQQHTVATGDTGSESEREARGQAAAADVIPSSH